MKKPPEIESSTPEERERYIIETFYCRGNCDVCGMCQVYHGKSPEIVYRDYIDGKRDFRDIAREYRR